MGDSLRKGLLQASLKGLLGGGLRHTFGLGLPPLTIGTTFACNCEVSRWLLRVAILVIRCDHFLVSVPAGTLLGVPAHADIR